MSNYMNQAIRLWNEIFQIVKENCSTEYTAGNPQDDLMDRLLRFDEDGLMQAYANARQEAIVWVKNRNVQ